MSITHLSTELLQRIYEYAELEDVVHLAQTSRRIYRAFLGRRMPLLEQGMHNSYSPLPSLLKLVISNEPDKSRKPIGTEVRINLILKKIIDVGDKPKLTLELMKKMVYYGRIAERWTEIYPRLRWRFGSDNRRLLRPLEKERLRRAIYNDWTYTTLFHTRTYMQYAPRSPQPGALSDPRLRLLRTWSTVEHIQLSEFLGLMTQLIQLDLYPSNTVVQDHYSHTLPSRALAKIAWGEGNEYACLIRDIEKLSPSELLYLAENTTTKTERVSFLDSQDAGFRWTPATVNLTLISAVFERMSERREDPALKDIDGIDDGLYLPAAIPGREHSDVDDDRLLFGIVDTGSNKYPDLGKLFESDAIPNGELASRPAGFVPGLWVMDDGDDEDDEEETDDED